MQPDQQPTIRERIDTASNCLAFAARCLALSVEMFLHHGFGPRYVHLQALGALAAIFFWPALWPQE
ncbi:MAG: hypothetical protein KDA32_14335, partial [Phycisphaerales bacterium]|nr:hypothetical protein [Phycisphaerales bacterium]